jgi:hypothetical protein
MKYKVTFDISMSRFAMFKLSFSLLWHSLKGTGYVHFHEIGCDNLVKHLKEMKDND